MEDCHIERRGVAHRSQLFDENLLLIRVINMSTLDHETSTNNGRAVRGKVHVFAVLSDSSRQIGLEVGLLLRPIFNSK